MRTRRRCSRSSRAARPRAHNRARMLNIFTLANGRLFQEEIESLEELSKFQPIWVDLESTPLEEKRWDKHSFGLSITEEAMDEDIEKSARFYEEDNGDLHIRSDFLIA